jgi:hypothetical protein
MKRCAGLERVVDRFLALGLDGVDRAVHAFIGIGCHAVGNALELGLQRVDFLDQILAGDRLGMAVAAHDHPPGCGGYCAGNAKPNRRFRPISRPRRFAGTAAW